MPTESDVVVVPQEVYSWYPIHTWPNYEYVVSRHIEVVYGFMTFIPEVLTSFRQGNKRVERKTPLLARYIFVSCTPDQVAQLRDHRMRGITRGITSLLFEPIPTAQIEQWRTEIKKIAPSLLRVGALVRIVDGPMKGFEGILTAKDGDTISMSVPILGRIVPTKIEASAVEPIL